jgi:hypothetical protein
VCAAEELPVRLRAVADHLAAAVDASRRERVDGAFKRVEPVRLSGDGDLHRLVVVVSAGFALRHIEQRGCGPVRNRGEVGLIRNRSAALRERARICSCKVFVRRKAGGCRPQRGRTLRAVPTPSGERIDAARARGIYARRAPRCNLPGASGLIGAP